MQVSHASGVVFFILLFYQAFLPGPFSQPICTVTPGSAISCTMKKVPEILPWSSRDGDLDNRAGTWFTTNHFVPLYFMGQKRQKCQPEKPDQEDSIQGSTESLESGKTSVKEDEGKKSSRPSEPSGTSNTTSKKRERLEDFGFQLGSSVSKRPRVDDTKLFSSFTNETSTGLLSKSPNLEKQASKEKASTARKFNPKWKEEFPWLLFDAEENVMICNLCWANSSVAGKTDFLKGCSNFKK